MSAGTYARQASSRTTPQSEPIPGSSQVQNSAGGFAFPVDDWTRLSRFLILGNIGGSYYATEQKMTQEAAAVVLRCADVDALKAVNDVAWISKSGRAPKNDQAIFALAMLCAHPEAKIFALDAIPEVCRTGTHLFQFIDAVEQFRGWGRSLKRAVGKWYTEKSVSDLSYQLVKYQQRNGWSHRDVLRLAKPKVRPEYSEAIRWAVGKSQYPLGDIGGDVELSIIDAFEQAKRASTASELCRLIRNHGLTREMIPTNWLNNPDVWAALLEKMPLMAMIRNLGKMSAVGLLKPMSEASSFVADRLTNQEWLVKARIHPVSLLMAGSVYRQGQGVLGSLRWNPDSRISGALEDAFYLSFGAVVPTGKRHLIALDVSGSMGWSNISGTFLTPREASSALALTLIRTERITHTVAFSGPVRGYIRSHSSEIQQLGFDGSTSLTHARDHVSRLAARGTDCALPMLYAMEQGIEVDAFVVLTDSETWAGDIHPVQALRKYRDKTGISARLIVVGMVSNGFSIADPDDGGMMDCCGFDTSTPNIMADFSRGGI